MILPVSPTSETAVFWTSDARVLNTKEIVLVALADGVDWLISATRKSAVSIGASLP